jgi:cyclic pyranopterin phosphate synthase
MTQPRDLLGRPLRDLRISVTDRCNFRCRYCMPREVFGSDFAFLPRTEILSFEEIERLARSFVGMGVQKLRLTGGEPLLRRDLHHLVAMLARIEGAPDLALTTNGSLLAKQARALRQAGLRRLTISLDSLDPETFAAFNDTGVPLQTVLDGIDAALQAGFAPLKLNMVVKRGINEHDIPAMLERFGGPEFIVRFIEYMDVGTTNGWRLDEVVPADEILARAAEAGPLTPLPAQYGGEVARRYRTARGGELGVISSVSQPFCSACTRARLSADGHLYHCLFATSGLDLRAPLRSGLDDAALSALIASSWQRRDDRYSELRSQFTEPQRKVEMSMLGG